MFYSLTGNIIHSDINYIALECGGIAFKINTSAFSQKKTGGQGNKATFFTYMSVREDAIEIFGFADKEELEIFKLLIDISGVGPKAAVSILSAFDYITLTKLIAAGDSKSITKAQGIGPKIAQRIVLELKDKIKKNYLYDTQENESMNIIASDNSNIEEAISALVVLGYSKNEAARALVDVDGTLPTDKIIKIGLNNILRRG